MRLRSWLSKALCEPDGTPSTKRLLFALVVIACVGFSGGAVWQAKALSEQVVDLMKTALYATAGGYAVGRFAEKGQGNAAPDSAGVVGGAAPAPIEGERQ